MKLWTALLSSTLILTACASNAPKEREIKLLSVVLNLEKDVHGNCTLGEGQYSDLYSSEMNSSGEQKHNGAPYQLLDETGNVVAEGDIGGGLMWPQGVLYIALDEKLRFPNLTEIKGGECFASIDFNDLKISTKIKSLSLALNKRNPIKFLVSQINEISPDYVRQNQASGDYSNQWRIDVEVKASDSPNGGATAASHWYPKGFIETSDGVAYMFDSSVKHDCYSFGACWGMRVITREGCPELAIEGNALDSAGAVVQSVNDYPSSLDPMQEAKVVLRSSESTARVWQLKLLECRR